VTKTTAAVLNANLARRNSPAQCGYAYGETYKFDGKAVEHHIDISYNVVWTGTTQIRDIKKEGRKLIYTTRPAPHVSNGKMSIITLVWEKVT
jgi:Lipocalin-like domain